MNKNIIMVFKRVYAGIMLSLTFTVVNSQQGSQDNVSDLLKPVEVIPPAPNAASLGKYGGIDFGLSSGAMNTSVPIYTYASANIQVPVSISYSSNGFKVDEISSRVGHSWSLNAGGVITRTVYGAADEYSTRLSSTFSSLTRSVIDNFLKPVSLSNNSGGYDAQPDRFSFNFQGHSGQFILDSSHHPILLSYSNLKIEDNFSTPNPTWDFKITTAEGVQYFFGGDSAREVTNKYTSGCGHDFPDFFPTAFYLKKIVHPNNDVVDFKYLAIGYNYRTGLSQDIFYQLVSQLNCIDEEYRICPSLHNYIQTCVSWLRTNGVLLKEINSSSGGKLLFKYRKRNDITGTDSLISRIELYQPVTNNLTRVFDFLYEEVYSTKSSNSDNNTDASFGYRYFLKNFIERSPDSLLLKIYDFDYNNLSELPRRLSYAQDHYGNYNGKTNTSLIPKPATLTEQGYFPTATANRDPDDGYAKKGLLSKITYPTGGRDTIFYEGNTIWGQVEVLPAPTNFNVSANSADLPNPQTAISATATISFTQETIVYGSCTFYGTPAEDDPIHNKATISLYNNSNVLIYQWILFPGQIISSQNIFSLSQGSGYYLKIVATGTKVMASASFAARIGNITYQNANIPVGGIRVAKVVSKDGVTSADAIKKYNYAGLASLTQSSGVVLFQPIYVKNHTVLTACNVGFLDCGANVCTYLARFSGSQSCLSAFASQPVTYKYVTESYGDNFENGGIEHQYTFNPDMPGQIKGGDNIPGAPLSNQSITNGREIFSHTFKKVSGNTISVKKVFTHYKDDSRYASVYSGYAINRKLSAVCESTPPSSIERMSWDIVMYQVLTNWAYVDSVRTQLFDINGTTYNEQLTLTEYGNLAHALPTKISTTGSDLKSVVVNNYYPNDLTLTGPEETARQQLVSKRIISPVLRQQSLKDATQVSLANSNYNVFPNGLVLPFTQNVQFAANPIEERIRFYNYDNYGKLLEQAKANDARQSYIWSSLGVYPTAQAINASPGDIAYTSFENDGAGGWAIGSSLRSTVDFVTGRQGYVISNGNITKGSLTTTKSYVVSLWAKTGAAISLNGVSFGSAVFQKNGWGYYQKEIIPSTGLITVSGSGSVDELRLYPKGAQMTTFTYDPLIGVTSQCDINNTIAYYEYDALGRLLRVKDADKYIIKQLAYQYRTFTHPNPVWQTISGPVCEQSGGQNTGYQLTTQRDINPNSPTYNQANVISTYNTTACPLPVASVTLTTTNYMAVSGFTAVYTNTSTSQIYTFGVSALSGLRTLGTLPQGTYNLTISKSGNNTFYLFGSGCGSQSTSGKSATFLNISVNPSTCNSIYINEAL